MSLVLHKYYKDVGCGYSASSLERKLNKLQISKDAIYVLIYIIADKVSELAAVLII